MEKLSVKKRVSARASRPVFSALHVAVAQTSRFLNDPFTAFESGFGVSHSVSHSTPALLYVLNSNELPYSP
jgi:hypothetical protein